MGGIKGQEVRKQFAASMTAKFRQLSDESEDNEKKWSLFRPVISD